MTVSNSFLVALLANILLVAPAQAQNRFCNQIRNDLVRFNSTKTITIPAPRISGNSVITRTGGDDVWDLTQRVASISPGGEASSALNAFMINTRDSKTDNPDLGLCVEGLRIFNGDKSGPGEFLLSRKVLERSLKDSGNCKTMLGEKCVAALIELQKKKAKVYMETGKCPSGEYGYEVEQDTTVPEECRGLVNDHKDWPQYYGEDSSMIWADTGNLTHGLEDIFIDQQCEYEEVRNELNNTAKMAGGVGGQFNHSIRFPTPTVFTFFPNNTDGNPNTMVPHVEIVCLIPDEVQEGSVVPPSAQELLDWPGITFSSNATDPKEETKTTTGADLNSSVVPEGGAGALKAAAPVLGAVGMFVALLL